MKENMKKADTKGKKTIKKSVNKDKYKYHLHLREVVLSKESRKQLKKLKDKMWGDIANAIECGDWYVPSNTYEFIDVKTSFEQAMYKFFDIPKDKQVEIDSYRGDIMSFEKGIYPKY